MNVDLDRFRQDSFVAALGTFASYGVILLGMFVLLFVVPYAVFLFL